MHYILNNIANDVKYRWNTMLSLLLYVVTFLIIKTSEKAKKILNAINLTIIKKYKNTFYICAYSRACCTDFVAENRWTETWVTDVNAVQLTAIPIVKFQTVRRTRGSGLQLQCYRYTISNGHECQRFNYPVLWHRANAH